MIKVWGNCNMLFPIHSYPSWAQSSALVVWAIALAFALGTLGSRPAAADEISDMESEIKLLAKQVDLATERVKLLEQQRLLLEKQSAIITLQKAIATAMAPSKLVALKVNWARIVSLADQTKSCDASQFIAFTCNGAANNKCEFLIDQNICGDPSNNTDAKVMKVDYSCGVQAKGEIRFTYGLKGYLTCN